ncbi:MAG TPA: 3-phosphoshikimate 1-carboxyvinyltransferase [Polyangia bacterium]|jgi:3-phosphoshikimate 1-carboxyvinyltransferase
MANHDSPSPDPTEPLLRVRRSAPLRGSCRVPGDKSISHRALLFGALCDGAVAIDGIGRGGDNVSTARALTALGARVDFDGARAVVNGVGLSGFSAAAGALDCGNSGTTIRLLTGFLAGQPFETTLFGDASLTRRPMLRLAAPLRQMGASIEGRSDAARPQEIFPPLVIRGGRLHGIQTTLPVASAQLKSALVLAALQADGASEIIEPGLSRDHTERMLRHLGAPLVADRAKRSVRVDPAGWNRRLTATSMSVPGDLSSAAFLMVAALIVPDSDVTIEAVGLNPTRAGVIDALRAMGADLTTTVTGDAMGEPVGSVRVRHSRLRGTHIDGELALRSIDEIPALAMAAAVAEGVTVFSDLKELRVKESDRIASLARELGRARVPVAEQPDGLTITGVGAGALRGGTVQPMHDHRIAMSGAVLGLVSDEETVIPAAEIATSFPSFAETLRALGASLT